MSEWRVVVKGDRRPIGPVLVFSEGTSPEDRLVSAIHGGEPEASFEIVIARERICGAVNDGWSIKADDVAIILCELDRLRAERDAAWQAGAEAMREAAAAAFGHDMTGKLLASSIRALPIPKFR